MMWQHVVELHAALRHAATSPNMFNDVILQFFKHKYNCS